MIYYNRNVGSRKNNQWRDFLAACREYGEWAVFDPYYMQPTGVLGLELPVMEWWNLRQPWWLVIADRLRRWGSTLNYIYRALHPHSGWCRWEDDSASFYDWRKPFARAWYTLKGIACLLLGWKHYPKTWYDTVEVAAWNLGSDYWGEAQGDTLVVGRGILRNWCAHESSV